MRTIFRGNTSDRATLAGTAMACCVVWAIACPAAAAGEATIRVGADDVLHERPVSLIGGNTEDLNGQLYGGLYSQLLYGEAFEEQIDVRFLGLAPREELKVWVRRDGKGQPFLWLFEGRGFPSVDDIQADVERERRPKLRRPVSLGSLRFTTPYLVAEELPGDLGKRLLDRFTGTEQVSRHWRKLGSATVDGSFTLVQDGSFTGRQAQRISFSEGQGEWGIDNAGLHRWGIKLTQGKPYEGILRVKSETRQTLWLSLRDENGRLLDEKACTLQAVPDDYQRLEFTLTPNASTAKGRFALVLRKPGMVTVDYAFLQPGAWGRFHGQPVRRDLVEALGSMTVAAMRYNGSMVNRCPDGHLYKWKEMIGPRDRRQPYHGWFNPYASHGFSIFEFMDLCEQLDVDCMFGIRIDENEQDVRDLVEYCLGTNESAWGRKRIAYGHPKPYRLGIIQIGNEEAGDVHYAERFKVLAGAIWDENPNLEVALSLNVRGWEPGNERARVLLDIARFVRRRGQDGKLILDAHYHSRIDHADTGLTNFVGLDMHDYLAEQIPGFELRLWPMEENGSRCDWDRGLAHAHNLNTFNRLPLCVERTGAANTFQAWQQHIMWDQGRIHFTPGKIFYQPSYYVDRMFGVEWLPVVLDATSSAPGLDVTAKMSEARDVLTLYVVNIGEETIETTLELDGFRPARADVLRIGSLDLTAKNTPEAPGRIRPVRVGWDANAKPRIMSIPGRSFTTIRLAQDGAPALDVSAVAGPAVRARD